MAEKFIQIFGVFMKLLFEILEVVSTGVAIAFLVFFIVAITGRVALGAAALILLGSAVSLKYWLRG